MPYLALPILYKGWREKFKILLHSLLLSLLLPATTTTTYLIVPRNGQLTRLAHHIKPHHTTLQGLIHPIHNHLFNTILLYTTIYNTIQHYSIQFNFSRGLITSHTYEVLFTSSDVFSYFCIIFLYPPVVFNKILVGLQYSEILDI
jgi:hypothetical protein